jgi:hypothetical protein
VRREQHRIVQKTSSKLLRSCALVTRNVLEHAHPVSKL